MNERVKIVECPRDAMQGIHDFIKTEDKINHLKQLLAVGFDTIDCGSFVSPKVIPQMADTPELMEAVEGIPHKSKLSVIIASRGGAERALKHDNVDLLGFPFSISEKFQQYNTHKSREDAFSEIADIVKMTEDSGKEVLLYFSMAFGNPYGEKWDTAMVKDWASRFADLGIRHINLSDTTSVAHIKDVEELFETLIPRYPEIEFGGHFHSEYNDWRPKIEAAYNKGCRRFDGAIKGFGGCPMSHSDMVGNTPTEKIITFVEENGDEHGLDMKAFESAYNSAMRVMG